MEQTQASAQLTSREIRGAFCSPIAQIPVTLGYRLRLLAVLTGLALLQTLYLLLIAAVGFLCYLYMSDKVWAEESFNALTILFYLGVPTAGAIAILFLLKPIVIRPQRPPKPIRLQPEN